MHVRINHEKKDAISETTYPKPTVVIAEEPLLTAEEFARFHTGDPVELVNGVVRPLQMGEFQHGCVCANIGYELAKHARETDFERACCNNSFVLVKRNPDTVRGPDVALYSHEQLAKGKSQGGLLLSVPDVVVEVVAESEVYLDAFRNVPEYLIVGVRVIVVFYLKSQAVNIFRDDAPPETIRLSDTLTIPDVLPGFTVPLAKLFG